MVDVAETELRRRLNAVSLEQPAVVSVLFRLLLGEPATQGAAAEDQRTAPPGPKLLLVLVTQLLRSRATASTFPQAMQAAFTAMFSAGHARARTLGLQFTHRIFELAPLPTLSTVAAVFLSSVMKIVRDASATSQDRGLAAQAVGKLSLRCPAVLSTRVDLLAELFEVCVGPDAHVRSCAFDALTMLSAAFKTPSEATAAAILALCSRYVQHNDSQARLLAARYCLELFPTTHMPSRWVCLRAAVDEREDIKAEGERGLRRVKAVSATTAEIVIDPHTQLVAFPDVVSFITDEIATLQASGAWSEATSAPPFDSRLLCRTLEFLRHALGVSADADEDETTFLLRTGSGQPRLYVIASYLQMLDMVPECSTTLDAYMRLLDLALVCMPMICSL